MRGFMKIRHHMRKLTKSLWRSGVIGIGVIGTSGLLLMNPVFALPVENNVAAGTATVSTSGSIETIDQSTQKAIINWNNFNINQGETTRFVQPTGGMALNRISPSSGAAQIYGNLTANGQIILVDPAGIYFGSTAYVNVGGLIATTENITDQNFLNGNYYFSSVPGYSGSISNEGEIVAAQHGLIALVGRGVENDGLIEADLGQVVLASGDAVTMAFDGNNLISFVVNTPTSQPGINQNGNMLENGVLNTGKIIANGGEILITAQAAAGVLNDVINMQGIAQAESVSDQHGQIILMGGNNGEVYVGGTLNASGSDSGQTGGNVMVTGYDVLLDSPSLINVSGNLGGGTIYIGGNARGLGPLPNANAVIMEPGATLLANAITNGNGGHVVLWSNNYTGAFGVISATGGALGGNGGYVETSSGNLLNVAGLTVNTTAPTGTVGTWLLDPYNVTICSGSGCTTSGGSFSSGTFTPDATSTILNTDIETNLATSSVTITTGSAGSDAGNITIDANVPITWTAPDTSFNLSAANNIAIDSGATITGTASGDQFNIIGNNATIAGDINVNDFSTNLTGGLTFNNGSITTTALQSYNNPITLDTNTTLSSGGGIAINNNISGAGETLTLEDNGQGVGGGSTISPFTIGSPSISLGNLNIIGNNAHNDELILQTIGNHTWNITGNDTGNIVGLTGVTGNVTFSNVGMLYEASSGNSVFNFESGGSLSNPSNSAYEGLVVGNMNLGYTSTLDVSSITSPMTITVTSSNMLLTNNQGSLIASLSGLNTAKGNGQDVINVPVITGFPYTLTGPTSSIIDNLYHVSGFTLTGPNFLNSAYTGTIQQSAGVSSNTTPSTANRENETTVSGHPKWVTKLTNATQNVNDVTKNITTSYQKAQKKVVINPICLAH